MRSPSLAAALLAMVLAACSASEAPDKAAEPDAAGTPAAADGAEPEPGTSLAFEWSANGFEQIEARYQWSGSGKRDDVFQPNLSLSVPETDDAIWSSSCEAGGKVTTQLYLAPPKGMEGGRATFRFETDASRETLAYPARYVADGQYDGFTIVQPANDPMFADMEAGQWAYIQIGEGSDAVKLRIALTGAKKALAAFLPACSATRPAAALPKAASLTQGYSCEDGRRIAATYSGNDSDTPTVRLAIGERELTLAQVPSGSGARYEAEFAGQTFQWLTKAEQGTLIIAQSGDPASATEQSTSCTAM